MQLKELTIEDYPQIQQYFKKQWYDICAYTPLSLTVWQTDDFRTHWTIVDDAFLIASVFPKDASKNHLILPVDGSRLFLPADLANWAKTGGFSSYWFVPESYIEQVGRGEIERYFIIEEDSGYSDYIYQQSDLAELKGKKYSKKRNLINQFMREHDVQNDVTWEPLSEENAPECLEFLDEWCRRRHCEDSGYSLACEREAVITTLSNTVALKVNGRLLRLKGDVVAFAVAEPLTDTMGVLHFEKAFAEITGLYQYFDQLVARELMASFELINKESDMGEPGLAKAKKSYYPVRMATCYQLIIRDEPSDNDR